MKIRELMHEGIEVMPPETPLAKLAQKMREKDIGAIPVGTKDGLKGIVTDRDIAIRAVANGKDISQLTAADIMTKGAFCCRDDERVADVLGVMEQKRIRRMPVMDEKRHLVGIISLGDISHAVPGKLTAEIVRAVSAHHR
jgi:CBS domain-containing protein